MTQPLAVGRRTADIYGYALTGADLSDLTTEHLCIGASQFEDCSFRGLTVTRRGNLGKGGVPTHYIRCDFTGMRATEISGGESVFVGCTFRDVRLSKAFFLNAEFVDCVFSGELSGAVFSGRPKDTRKRTRNRFVGNDFSGVEWRYSEFRGGIDLRRQLLPSGPYAVIERLPQALAAAREEVCEHWDRGRTRNEVLLCFFILDWVASSGQAEAFLRIDEICDDPAAAQRAVDLLLRSSVACPTA